MFHYRYITYKYNTIHSYTKLRLNLKYVILFYFTRALLILINTTNLLTYNTICYYAMKQDIGTPSLTLLI